MKKSIATLAVALAVGSASVLAGGPPPPTYSAIGSNTAGGTKTNTKAYAGLNWNLGGGWTPSVVLGVFNTRVKADGDTEGANLAFHLNVAGGIKPGKIKLSYLNGKEDIQGELGLGYDFVRGAPLLALGANAPFVALGVDGYLNGNIVPFITLHSQEKFDKPTGSNTRRCVLDTPSVFSSGHYTDANCASVIP